jgi:hypothetical protein
MMAVRDFLRRYRDHLGRSVGAAALRGDHQQVKASFNSVFDDAKRLSDFVGLVTRIVVCLFGTVYFAKLAQHADNFLKASALWWAGRHIRQSLPVHAIQGSRISLPLSSDRRRDAAEEIRADDFHCLGAYG